ncbi:hypothetical protein PRZ48_013925 [Zasmidium cellare]|uniref:Fungal STAND N-terminal Goodbye domain-containing protein n=1 Tax=Zasmidium cellare TaxID=395010 RepID=A0ABR0DZI5_ZASCE|nr:hypothetical protein PRZ48_013925 [Zasmidium cellare]
MVKPKADGTLNTDTSRDLDVVWADVVKERVNQGIDESSSKNKSKAKDVLNKAAICIQKFGGMIAQAASVVFGPAGQCYNAISFVISAAKSIQEVIDGYITLLEHCVAFLQRITMHLESHRLPGEERLPVHLRGPAYQGLELFLKVQAHSRNLAKSKRTKLKVFCGVVLFSDDDGVKGNLSTLTELSCNLTNNTTDQILEDVKGLARHLQKSDEERKQHEAECREYFKEIGLLTQQTLDSSEKTRALVGQLKSSNDDAENLKRIESAFKAITDKDVSDKRWVEQHKTIQRERIAGTGKWLLDSKKFKLWSSITPSDTLSVLKGNGGFGKTFLCSHVVDSISTYSKEASNERVYVGYYYFEKGASVDDCIGSLVYQLAVLDKTYRRAVANACSESASFGGTAKLWKSLVVDLAGSMHGHYFLVIDGYPGDGDSHLMRDIIQHSIIDRTASIRLFLSGRYENLENLDGVFEHGILCRLGEGRPGLQRQMSRSLANLNGNELMPRAVLANEQDVLDYAVSRVESLCKSNPDLKATMQDPQRDIPAKLARGARGDFTSLESKLNEIAEAQDNDTIEEIISRAGETRKESCDRVIRDLYDALTVEEIKELNMLLKWIYEGKQSDEKLLNAVLLWSTSKSYFLGKQIDTKFKSVLRHDQRGLVSGVFAADTIRTATPNIHDAENNTANSLGQGLQQCEVDIVQHFVKTYCSGELYERFRFHDFFRSKAADQAAIVHLDDSQRTCLTILRTCLEVLCEKKGSDPKFTALREYAAIWLGEHLQDVDLFGPDQKALQELAARLITLLYNDDAIDAWWTPELCGSLPGDWVQDPALGEMLQKLVDLFKHPPVFSSLDNSPQSQWIKSILGKEGDNTRLLVRTAERLADRWFSAVRQNTTLFRTSQSIMAKIWGSSDVFSAWSVPSAREISRFVQYARDKSTRGLSGQHWETRKASALYAYGHISEAFDVCEQAERAAADGPLPWPLLLVKARITFSQKRYQETLIGLHKMEENNRIDSDLTYSAAYWDTVLLLEGQSHKALLENEAAIECFVKLLNHGLDEDAASDAHNEALTELFDTWRQMKQYHQIVNHVQAWRQPAKLDLHYWLPRLAYEERFHRLVVLAVVQTKTAEILTHAIVGQLYDDAIQRLCENKGEDSHSDDNSADQLRYFRASILFHASINPADQTKALAMWEKLLESESSDGVEHSTWTNFISVCTLARLLLDKGLADYSLAAQGLEGAASALEGTVKRLEALATENTPVLNMCRSGDSDPRLALARLKLKVGDERDFKRIVMARLQKQFDKWPAPTETEALVVRYASIAHTLTVADDQQNAIAAWQMIALPQNKKVEHAIDAPNDRAVDATVYGDSGTAPDAILGASDPENTSAEERTVVNGDSSKEEELSFAAQCPCSCDEYCGTSWPVIEDLYACKHCLDVQLCPDCYEKLIHGELPPLICNPMHEFLYVPTMDRAAWLKAEPNEMIVGGEIMKRQAWLDGLRDKWDLRQDQIDARRSRAAARFRAVVGAYVLSMKGYHQDAFKDDPKRIELVEGVYKWV